MAESIIDTDMGQMTHRERFRRTMHFQKVDRVPHWEFGYLGETQDRWHQEGLPAQYDNDWRIESYFGVDPSRHVPFHGGIEPSFEGEWEVLQKGEDWRRVRTPDGAIFEEKTSGIRTIPHYIKMPVENRDDWARFKERLDPEDPRRFGTDYKALGQELMRSDLPVGIGLGSYFGIPRDWLGFERISMMLYDDRDLVEDIVETLTRIYYRQIEEALKYIEVDFAAGWEDICFRSGPMLSPQMFREIVGPRLKRVCDLLRQHGCTVIWTDCDGDVTPLVPIWLEAGLNCMFPLEVFPGSDPVKYREMWGRQILLRGGLNKHLLAEGKREIIAELKRVEHVVEDGGFIPHGDHRIPQTVSLENYRYYIRNKLAMLGWRDDDIAQVEGLRGA